MVSTPTADPAHLGKKTRPAFEQRILNAQRRARREGGEPKANGAHGGAGESEHEVGADRAQQGAFAGQAVLFMGSTRLALALETWRQRHGAALLTWLGALGKVEALSALAAYAYENPSDPYPELVDAVDAGPCFLADEIGHPLLPAAQCVRNDVRLDRDVRLLIVSGSNIECARESCRAEMDWRSCAPWASRSETGRNAFPAATFPKHPWPGRNDAQRLVRRPLPEQKCWQRPRGELDA
jgi:hypothetical protein